MADLQTITIASGSGDTVEQALVKLRDDQIKDANTFADTADPAATTHGRAWFRTDEERAYYRNGAGTKTPLLWAYKLDADLDCNAKELDNAHLQEFTTGALPAAGAAQESREVYDSTVKLPVVYTDTGRFYLPRINIDASEYVAIPCTLNTANTATAATADTTTRFAGFLMDGTADELNWVAQQPVPAGWTGAHDLLVEVMFSLSAAETAGDDVDMDMDWIALTGASGDGTDKTVTASPTVNYDIGATATAQFDLHKLRATIDHDDVTNPVAAGDWLQGTLQRNTVGGPGKVANIVVHQCTLLVPSFRIAWQ